MSACPNCGAAVGYVYGPDGDELIVIDQGQSENGNVRIDGGISGHYVQAGLGTHQEHDCKEAGDRA